MTMLRTARGVGVVLLMSLLGALAACDRPDADVDFGGEDLGAERFSVLSENGGVKMGLTDRVVYFALSDSVLNEVRSDMEREKEKKGLGGIIGGILSKTVGKALGFRAKYPVEEIRDIRWQDGEMRVEFEDGDRRLEDFKIDDRPVTEAFSEESVRAFAEAFRQVKQETEGSGA